MKGSLDSAFSKLERARSHLATIENLVPSFDDTPFEHHRIVRAEMENEGCTYRFYIGELAPLNPNLTFHAGECLFNARCALDHLVYQLHYGHFRGSFPDQSRRDSAFPIQLRKPSDAPHKWRGIKALSRRDRQAIAWLQPHMARHDKLQGVRYQLGVLERLHVIDKHRELHIARQVATATLLTRFPNEYGFREEWVAGRTLESNMNVLRWTFHAAPPPALVQAKVGAYTGLIDWRLIGCQLPG